MSTKSEVFQALAAAIYSRLVARFIAEQALAKAQGIIVQLPDPAELRHTAETAAAQYIDAGPQLSLDELSWNPVAEAAT